MQGCFTTGKSINIIHQAKEEKKSHNHIIDAEKSSNRIQHPFIIKTLRKPETEFPQLDKEHLQKTSKAKFGIYLMVKD